MFSCAQTSALFCHHQRSFPSQQTDHRQACAERVLRTHTSKWRSPSNPSQSSENSKEEEQKESKSQSGWRTPGELATLIQLSKVHMNSQRLNCKHGAYMGLYQVFCIYFIAFGIVFLCDSWVWESVGPVLLGFLPSVGMPCPAAMWWFLRHRIIFYFVMLVVLEDRSCEGQRGSGGEE